MSMKESVNLKKPRDYIGLFIQSSSSCILFSMQTESFTIVLPTYNESESLPVLVKELTETLSIRLPHPFRIVVVDDQSPDGTAAVARELGKTYPVDVRVRDQNPGLSASVLEGILHAGTDICIVMDADGSHPIEAIPRMVELLVSGAAECVVGSRYLKGGGMPDWPFYRQFISRCNAWLALGLSPLTDATSGFMAIRKSRIEWKKVNPLSWKIVLEICAKHPGLSIKEVSIIFRDRVKGVSKAGLSIQWDYLRHLYVLYRVRFPTFWEFGRFCLVGASGVLIDITTMSLSQGLWGLDIRLAAGIGFVSALTSNYLLNRHWTFFYGRHAPVLRSYSVYAIVALVGFSVRLAVLQGFLQLPSGTVHPWVAAFVALTAGALVNFIGSRAWVFRYDE